MMRVGVRGLISFFMILAGHGGLLGRNDDIQTKRELLVNPRKHPGPVHEYELLLQMSYRDPNEKKTLKNFLQLLGPSSLLSHGPVKMIRAKATTYCSSVNGGLQCACEDDYAWFPPTCLDPQQCHLHMERPFWSCNCQGNNLSQSVNFCERTKIWGTFEINEKFTIDLLNSSSAIFSNYTTRIEIQLKGVYKRIQGFESIRVTQFRELIRKLKLHHNINAYVEGRCTLVGYEVIGSSSPSELLSAIERAAEQAREALHKLFPLEDASFRVFGQGNTGVPLSGQITEAFHQQLRWDLRKQVVEVYITELFSNRLSVEIGPDSLPPTTALITIQLSFNWLFQSFAD